MNKNQDVANAGLPNVIRFIIQEVLWKSVSHKLLSSGWFTSSEVQALIKCWFCVGVSQFHLLCIHSGVVGPDFISSDSSFPLCCTMAFLLHFSSGKCRRDEDPSPPSHWLSWNRFCWHLCPLSDFVGTCEWAQISNSQAEADGELRTYNVVAKVLFPLETRQKKKFTQYVLQACVFLLFVYLSPQCPIWIKYISNPAYTALFC